MKPELKEEFRTVVLAIAREYGAHRDDLVTIARNLPTKAPARRGPREIDDDQALAEAVRMRLDGRAGSDWEAARAVAPGLPGQSVEATERRLHRAMRNPVGFYKMFPDAARIEVLPEEPFERAHRALAQIRPKSRK